MKYFILLFTLFVINNVFSQESDSQTVRIQIDSLMKEANTLYNGAFRERALETIQKAKGLAKDNFGINSKVYGDVCQQEGWYLENMGYFKKAKNAFQLAVHARQNTQPQEQSELAESLISLANVSRTLGDYNTAISAMKSLVGLHEQTVHHDPNSLYEHYAELAKLYREIGHFSIADSFYIKASALPEKFEIPVPESMPLLLYDWARMAMEMGHYQKAEEKFEQAKNLFDTKVKKKSPEYAVVLAGFASLYTYLGRHDKSKELLLEAKSRSADGWWLFKKLPYGPVLIGLTDLYKQTNELKKAEKLYLAALDIMESEGQTTVPEYPTALQELGIIYHHMGDDDESEYYLKEAVTKWETLSEGRIPGYPKTMMDLASLYINKAVYSSAKVLLQKSKAFWEDNSITDYPVYFYCLFDLSKVYWLTDDFAKADSLYAQAAQLGRNRLAEAIHYMSGNELDEYLSRFLHYKAEILHFATTSPISVLTSEACYDNTLFYKGFLLNAALQLKNQAQKDSLALPIYNTLIDYRRQIGYEYTKPLDERQDLSSLIQYADSLEKELVCILSGNTALSVPVTWKEIRNQLSEEEVAIEFIHYKAMTPMATDSIMYVAQLIYHDSDQPILIPIFEEKDLWVLLDGYTVRKADFVNDFYAHRDRGPVRIGKRIDLYDIIWRPINAVLRSDVKTIHIAPSGILHYLNFGAIPVTETKNLTDLYKINLLGSTRKLVPDLIMTKNDTTKTGYIFSGIDYNATGIESNNAAEINSDNNPSTDVEINSSRNEQLSGAWANLYWTAFEGDSISSLFSSSHIPFYHFKNKDAREEEVKKLGEDENASPGIIHFATHGFFYADKNSSANKQNTGSIFKSSENPMFRSGLIMAGANNTWKKEIISLNNTEDGILTAYEISQLNLSNTELVVLSACETGLGDIRGDEGVYGLQRAFKIAGAKYLIMSLWQVPDRETMEFMTTFYRNRLEGEMTIPDAFRQTQRAMRDRFFNPYSWAGFVLVE